MSFRIELIKGYLCFTELYIQFLPQFGKFSAIISLNKFSAPSPFFSLLPINLMLLFVKEWDYSCRMSSFF